ncbi:Uncharacterised protein [Salmonella enterica subsp. enterica serovar Bovismorbificans]|uniref:Uncharacterized protein n=1 Tax=Salmonella enterica subsp. enterica serovar Bovismorbificans TaxID=58097 RepID=A0A655CPA1_SALET|nr:Uncharacterised protein [Salmonella enterica subsp. enterica serovar Bovismorbificans]
MQLLPLQVRLRRQRMRGRHINSHPALNRQTRRANVCGIVITRFNQTYLGAPFLQQVDDIIIFSDQAFKLGMRKLTIKLRH